MSRPCLRLFAALALSSLAATALPAQDTPKPPLMSWRATGIQQLMQSWSSSRLGTLLAGEDVAPIGAAVMRHLHRHADRSQRILECAVGLELELPPHRLASLFLSPDYNSVMGHPFAETRSLEILAVLPEGDYLVPLTVFRTRCEPQYEGRWSLIFEREMETLLRSPWFVADRDAKIGGNPAVGLKPMSDEQQEASPFLMPLGLWKQHLPGTFLHGSGTIEQANALVLPSPCDTPQVALTLDLQQYLGMFGRFGGVPTEFAALGFTSLDRFEWRARFVGDLLLSEIELGLRGQAEGLVGALLNHDAPLPKQAIPDGGMLQVRTAVDLRTAFATVRSLAGTDFELTTEQEQDVCSGLTGGVAFGIAAPAPGGLIPRFYLTLGIADEVALRRVLDAGLAPMRDAGTLKQVTYDGVECTTFQFDDVPQGVAPTFCIHDGLLQIAESGRSLRALLRAQGGSAEAMDVGDAPLPAADGAGERVEHFDLRFDAAALYAAFAKTWLPLWAMSGMAAAPPAVAAGDMPSPEVVAEYLRPSRGILRRDGDRYTLQHLGVLGGPELAALAMTWAAMLSSEVTDDTIESLLQDIARYKLERVWPALEDFQKNHHRWPQDLAELFAAAELAPDALLMPGDDLAEPVGTGNGGMARSSFRYFPQPVAIKDQGPEWKALLIEIRPVESYRSALDVEGALQQIHGDAAKKPIDRFGQ